MIERIGPESALMAAGLTEAPTASVGYGAAGVAYALYRIACATSDPAHLATAEIWLSRAALEMNKDEAFHNVALEMTPEVVGRVSPLHAAPGIFCVEALLSQARGDLVSQQAAIDGFAALSQAPCDNLDATLGRCGTMLTAAMLLETIPAESQIDTTRLRAVGDDVMRALWEKLDSYGPVSECPELRYSGVAHGWAGMLYATMRWCHITGQSLPATVEPRTAQLAELAEPIGRGARWPWVIPAKGHRSQVSYMPGWCNGSAGFVHFWTLAHERFQHERYLSLAHRAAWNAWESSGPVANLCCGLAGQSYALLNLFKHTGEQEWLQRARDLAIRAVMVARDPQTPRQTGNDGTALRDESLYKGGLGVAILAAELATPRAACMPFFESEG
jgi:serine/threonine-protein kinase